MEICTIGPPREYTEMLEKQKNASKSFSMKSIKLISTLIFHHQAACNFGPFSLLTSVFFLRSFTFFGMFLSF